MSVDDAGSPHRDHVGSSASGGQRDAGYTVLEIAVIAPVILLLTFLVIQWALVWHGRHVAQAAAQGGLSSARAYGASPDAGNAAATDYLTSVAPRLLRDPHVTTSLSSTTATVTVRADVQPVLSFLPVAITERASGPLELFATAP